MNESLEKINSQIQYQLAFAIREIYPDSFATVTSVSATLDLDICRVFVSLIDDNIKTVDILNKRTKTFRKHLADNLNLRHTPEIRFYLDDSDSKFNKIDELIDGIKKSNR